MNRHLLIASLAFIVTLFMSELSSHTAINDTNSVLGIVGPPDRVMVEVYNRSDIKDPNNSEGLYCLLIPKSITEFQVAYVASCCYPKTLPESNRRYRNNLDRQKLTHVSLRRKDTDDAEDPEAFSKLLAETLYTWQGVSSETKQRISSDLVAFRNHIQASSIPRVRKQRSLNLFDQTLRRMSVSPR